MKRRQFLQNVGFGLAASAFSSPLAYSQSWREFVKKNLGAGKVKMLPGISIDELRAQRIPDLSAFGNFSMIYCVEGKSRAEFHLLKISSQGRMEVATTFEMLAEKPHEMVLSGNRERLLVLPTEGRSATVFSTDSLQPLFSFEPVDQRHVLLGHGVFSPDGREIYVSEILPDYDGEGCVTVRSASDGRVLRRFTTGYWNPNELKLVDEGRKLLVGHYGRFENSVTKDGGFSILNAQTGFVWMKPNLHNQAVGSCHIDVDEEGRVMLSSRSWIERSNQSSHHLASPIFFGSVGATDFEGRLEGPHAEKFRLNFSVKLSAKQGRAATCHMDGGLISIWDTKARRVISGFEIERPERPLSCAVSPAGDYFITTTTGGSLMVFKAKDGALVRREKLLGLGRTPHMALVAT